MSFSQRITEEEKTIINELRRLLRLKIRYDRTYIYKQRYNNIVKVKVWDWRAKDNFDNEQIQQYCLMIIRGLSVSRNAFFLKPVIENSLTYRFGNEYEIPCMFFYFNV